MIRTLAVAAALTTTLALAGCSDDSDSDKSDKEDESSGVTITGTGYSFEAPEGWDKQEYPEGSMAQEPDAFAVNADDDDGFADNVNVVRLPATEVTEEQVEQDFASRGAEVTFADEVTIAGSESLHAQITVDAQGVSVAMDQFYPTDSEGQLYLVTFSFNDDVPQDERDEAISTTLDSWSWEN